MKIPRTAIVLLPPFWPHLPPLGLAYLKGYLKKQGVEIDCLDVNHLFFSRVPEALQKEWRKSCNEDLERDIWDIIKNHEPELFRDLMEQLLHYDVLGFSCFKSNFPMTRKMASLLKKQKPDLRLILGGPEISSYFFHLQDRMVDSFRDMADFLVAGEGELPLFHYLTGRTHPPFLSAFQEQEDLTESPGPDFSDFDLSSYPKKSAISLMLSRGCIKKCRFCAERLLYKKFRLYPIQGIMQKISELKKTGIHTFIFHDSLINGNLSWLEDFCEAIMEHFGSIQWEAQIAIRRDMPDKLFSKMKQSGCYHLFVGLESGCSRTLEAMKKGYTAEEALEFFKRLKKADLSFGVSILVGYPMETYTDFLESLSFILEHKEWIPKIEQVNPFVRYRGLNLPEASDYKANPESLQRANFFIESIKKEGLKYTKAFLLNLVEQEWKSERLKSRES